jgi:hypothetical protein
VSVGQNLRTDLDEVEALNHAMAGCATVYNLAGFVLHSATYTHFYRANGTGTENALARPRASAYDASPTSARIP